MTLRNVMSNDPKWKRGSSKVWAPDIRMCEMERTAGIEPASSAWKAEVIAIIRCTR